MDYEWHLLVARLMKPPWWVPPFSFPFCLPNVDDDKTWGDRGTKRTKDYFKWITIWRTILCWWRTWMSWAVREWEINSYYVWVYILFKHILLIIYINMHFIDMYLHYFQHKPILICLVKIIFLYLNSWADRE